jgi:hypothetical protein
MADGDFTNLFGGTEGSTFGGSLFNQENLLSLGATDQPAAAATGSMYAPAKPNYMTTFNTGMGTLHDLYKNFYDNSETPEQPAEKPLAPVPTTDTTSSVADTDDRGYQATKDYLRHGSDFISDTEHDRMVGAGTTFGLDYDTAGNDAMDNGQGAFGYNTRDTNLAGASLPIAVIKNSIGDYTSDPKIFQAIKRGDYKVAVTNSDGVTRVVPIVDAGPAEWTGNAIDLTYRTSHDLNTGGKAQVGYQIIGPDGDTVKIRGFHPHSVERGNWHDHITPSPSGEVAAKPQTTSEDEAPTPHVAEEPDKSTAKPSEQPLSANTGATRKSGNDALVQANKQLTPQEQKDADAWLSWDWNRGEPPARVSAAYDKRAALVRQIMGG